MSEARNVVVFMCDQLRPDFLSLYGCTAIPTPNLDRLAREGVVFDRAITVSTVCAPARASMMTGRFVSDHGVWTNDVPFRDGLDYLPRRINKLGYATGAFGKLHHYPAADGKGFNVFHPMEEGRLGDAEPYLHWLKARHPEVSGIWNFTGHEFDYDEDEYYEHWIASRALDFIKKTRDTDSCPFLAWISFQGPHGPIDPPREVHGTCDESQLPAPLQREAVDTTAIPSTVRNRERCGALPSGDELLAMRLAYAEEIVAIDRQIGRVMQQLEVWGLYESTSFIFTADHGDMLADYRLQAKGPFPYRAQLEIPLLVANHPDLDAGTRSPHLSSNIDVPGTVLDIAGAGQPLGVSRSLIDLARENPARPRRVNFCEFCDSVKTLENRRYRFSYYPFSQEKELYDLEQDPDQTVNLAGNPDLAAVQAQFMQDLVDFLLIAKGVRIEAHDFVPEQQKGLAAKDPHYQERFPVAFPLTSAERERLKAAGMPADFNEFCRDKDVLRSYLPPYWQD